ANCYPVETQELFMSGMGILEDKAMKAFGESFFDVDQMQRESILMELDNEDDELEKNFYDFVKEQVVNAYTTSEYFLTNFTNYDMVPGGYDGCVTVPEEPFKI
ncbi:MAG: gluconate 2-dehydrogenase subunit 3 family protein, partial [Cyclobacteriaceae bacterium]|nr:gluconate 2-dehydrogenase subunit 3 family protein [Cyclobacteriaceae bacterium]